MRALVVDAAVIAVPVGLVGFASTPRMHEFVRIHRTQVLVDDPFTSGSLRLRRHGESRR